MDFMDKNGLMGIIRQQVIKTLLEQKKFIIAANWKMYKNTKEVAGFLTSLNKTPVNSKNTIVLFPPFPYLYLMRDMLRYSRVLYGVQNISWEKSGAYTGEISVDMAVDFGCRYSIVGHSERRSLFSETDEMTARKLETCLNNNIRPILCIGENYEERNSGYYKSRLKNQLVSGLAKLTGEKADNLIIAYEPVWAIGTGVNATAGQVEDTHGYIREVLDIALGKTYSGRVPILYGGSVKTSNVLDFALIENVSGFLIGGASLKIEEFTEIIGQLEGK